jgi:hypothetical protein
MLAAVWDGVAGMALSADESVESIRDRTRSP